MSSHHGWTVTLEIQPHEQPVDRDGVAALVEALPAELGAAADIGDDRWSVTMSIPEPPMSTADIYANRRFSSVAAAVDEAVVALERLTSSMAFPDVVHVAGGIVRTEVLTFDEHDRRLEQPVDDHERRLQVIETRLGLRVPS